MSFPTEVLCGKTTTEDGIIIASVCLGIMSGLGEKVYTGNCLFGRIPFSAAVIVRPVARNRGYR
jgi:hypothetical protein